jgi:hypothetical protein
MTSTPSIARGARRKSGRRATTHTERPVPPVAHQSNALVPGFPQVILPSDKQPTTRGHVLHEKALAEDFRREVSQQISNGTTPFERKALYGEVRFHQTHVEDCERVLRTKFVPAHGPSQFLSPRAFFTSPLFNVRNNRVPRRAAVVLTLPGAEGMGEVCYDGPELRQSDGLVFLSLLHIFRDIEVGTLALFRPTELCKAVFGRYDGNTRNALREHIQRLQKGLVIFENRSIQLCLGFDFPNDGLWGVGLDKKIVHLFQFWPEVWMQIRLRKALPDGLATWLYGYVESQTRLIPTKLSTLRDACGSDAVEKSFHRRFQNALASLAEHGVIEVGWSIQRGVVHWMKT